MASGEVEECEVVAVVERVDVWMSDVTGSNEAMQDHPTATIESATA
jgi:hypothetical protein